MQYQLDEPDHPRSRQHNTRTCCSEVYNIRISSGEIGESNPSPNRQYDSTYLLACLLTYLLTYLFTYLLTYLLNIWIIKLNIEISLNIDSSFKILWFSIAMCLKSTKSQLITIVKKGIFWSGIFNFNVAY